jgi:hypothetical protein
MVGPKLRPSKVRERGQRDRLNRRDGRGILALRLGRAVCSNLRGCQPVVSESLDLLAQVVE